MAVGSEMRNEEIAKFLGEYMVVVVCWRVTVGNWVSDGNIWEEVWEDSSESCSGKLILFMFSLDYACVLDCTCLFHWKCPFTTKCVIKQLC